MTTKKQQAEEKPQRGRPKRLTPKTDVAFTIRVESILIEKMRTISRLTNTPLKHLIDAAFEMAITNFEAKNGIIHIGDKKMDAKALLQRDGEGYTEKENGQ